jgi:exodeoxyribonuclease V beta subunit
MSARRVARPPVLRRIPLDRSAVIEASAGTGKTFTLENLVVELLLTTDVTIDHILLVTFTEKATNELRVRVRAKLEELRSPGDDAQGQVPTELDDVWVIDDDARERIDRALQSFDGATITTIHAFCQRVLRENAFASGRMFCEQQVDGRDAFTRAMREALRRDIACDRHRALWLGAALRTGWSIERIEQLLWQCMQSRGDLRPVLNTGALVQALNAFPIGIARRTGGAVELCRWGMHATTAKTVARRLSELADVVERAGAGADLPAYVIDAQNIRLDYLLEKLPSTPPRIGPAAELCAAALELARNTPTFSAGLAQMILPPVRDELARRKREAGHYDFDDMLALVAEALHGPSGGALVATMRDRWRYVLIDEFQDTDETQWSIFRRGFFDPGDRRSVVHLVGDAKQSIYRFRGADVFTYLRARDEIGGDKAQSVQLEHNYRATAALVAANNAIFDQTAQHPIFTGILEHTPLMCGRPDRTLVDGDGRAVSPVHVMRFREAADTRALSMLGERMGREIATITDPLRPWRLDGCPLRPSDVFVLTRTAREGRTIGTALRAAGVPHAFYKQDGLFQTDEAKELRTLLLAIDSPNDRARRLAAWLTPFFGLPLTVIERARDLPSTHPWVASFPMWKALADARDFDRLFEWLIRDTGLIRREIFFGNGERELTNYLHILELLLEHAHASRATIRDLVHLLSGLIDGTRLPLDLEGSVQRLDSERRAVQIMTIHKSKGLEAPIVFVAGGFWHLRGDDVRIYHQGGRRLAWVGPMNDPEVAKRIKAEEREEEERLMYVALTRAKGRLYLPCAMSEDRMKSEPMCPQPRALRGAYDVVNRRLADLLDSGEPLLSVEDVDFQNESARSAQSRERGRDWCPPAGLLCEEDDRAKLADLRRRRAGAFVTSYTRMKGDWATGRGASDEAIESIEAASETALRGARTSGVFLHELLERIPLASFRTSGFDSWRSLLDVSELFDEAVVAHRIEGMQREHAERLVWAAYTTVVRLPGRGLLGGIAAAPHVVREMDFVFPMAGPVETAASLRGVRGYVRGSIDLAFEFDGLTYFVDWKSDSLPSYAPESLDRRVRNRYETQARLYSVAIAKLLGVRTSQEYEARFGGMLYCFLRGFDAEGQGLWSARPSWQQVLEWESALRAPRYRASGTQA